MMVVHWPVQPMGRHWALGNQRCALAHSARAFQPSGRWYRGGVGSPGLQWPLCTMEGIGDHSMHGRALGIGTTRLCAGPGPLGLVDGGCGGCWWCPLITVVVAHHHGCRWVVAHERWEWGNWRRTLVCNAWALGPGGQGNGGDVAGGLRSRSSWWWCIMVVVSGW